MAEGREKSLREAAAAYLKGSVCSKCVGDDGRDYPHENDKAREELKAAIERAAERSAAGTPVDFDMDEWHWLTELVEAERLRIEKAMVGAIGDDLEWHREKGQHALRVGEELDGAYKAWLKSRGTE